MITHKFSRRNASSV